MTGDRDCFCTYHIMDVTKLQMTDNESKLLLHSQSTDLSFYPYVFMHKAPQILRVVWQKTVPSNHLGSFSIIKTKLFWLIRTSCFLEVTWVYKTRMFLLTQFSKHEHTVGIQALASILSIYGNKYGSIITNWATVRRSLCQTPLISMVFLFCLLASSVKQSM